MSLQQVRSNVDLQEPISKRTLTTRESIILLQSSKLNGCTHPPWNSRPDWAEFCQGAFYEDDIPYTLSDVQRRDLEGWQRAGTIKRHADMSSSTAAEKATTAAVPDLVQDVTADCSVVASLTAMTGRPSSKVYTLWAHVFHPWDNVRQEPAVSHSGKYVFRLYFNGCYRKVIIDDRLPTTKTDRKIHVIDRNCPSNMWPALLEKAYLKVRGGYDFPGSNSGTDLWVLTGWIPEQCFLQSDDFDCLSLWRRITKAYQFGDVLVTLGTGKLSAEEEKALSLSSEHDYAVIGIQESAGRQLVKIKNPWSNSPDNEMIGTREAGVIQQLSSLDLSPTFKHVQKPSENSTPGVSWVDLDQISQGFESIYLNWNPRLFRFRCDVHFLWDLTGPRVADGCFRFSPQYTIQSDQGGIVWLLLGRHFSPGNGSKIASSTRTSGSMEGFISMYAFSTDGSRVYSSEGALKNSPYVDTPHTLLKLDLSKNAVVTIVLSEQSLPRRQQPFTVSTLSLMPCTIAPAIEKYKHSQSERGAWTQHTAGGNSSNPLYYSNPQYSVHFNHHSNICILLETESMARSVHAALFWSDGKPVRTVSTRDTVGDTGEYSRGFATIEIANVPAGTYTVVCSTFEEAQTGAFRLHVSSNSPCSMRRLQMSGAGRFIAESRPARFIPGNTRVRISFSSYRLNRISVVARPRKLEDPLKGSVTTPLRIAIITGRGPLSQNLAISNGGDFTNTSFEATTVQDVNIEPATCATFGMSIVLERLTSIGSKDDETVDLEISSEEPLSVGDWIVDD